MTTVQEAIAKRDAFLETHPHLKPLQDKIDKELEAAGEPGGLERMEVLGRMMTGHVVVLGTQLNELSGVLKDDNKTDARPDNN